MSNYNSSIPKFDFNILDSRESMLEYLRDKDTTNFEPLDMAPILSHRTPIRRKTTSNAVKHLSNP